MRYSLQSRDLIADQVETAAGGHHLDGMVVVPGCDKNMPGVLMACELSIFGAYCNDRELISSKWEGSTDQVSWCTGVASELARAKDKRSWIS